MRLPLSAAGSTGRTPTAAADGDPARPEENLAEWQAELVKHHEPGRLVFGMPSDAEGLPQALANYEPGEAVTAWVCKGTSCSAPMTDAETLKKSLG